MLVVGDSYKKVSQKMILRYVNVSWYTVMFEQHSCFFKSHKVTKCKMICSNHLFVSAKIFYSTNPCPVYPFSIQLKDWLYVWELMQYECSGKS